MQFLQECWVLHLPDTDLHKCTSVHLWAWVAHQQSSWLHNTSWLHTLHNSLKFGIWCAVCWTTHGRRISSQPRSHSPSGISLAVIFFSFSYLRHYSLTSLQTYIIVNHSVYWLPHVRWVSWGIESCVMPPEAHYPARVLCGRKFVIRQLCREYGIQAYMTLAKIAKQQRLLDWIIVQEPAKKVCHACRNLLKGLHVMLAALFST